MISINSMMTNICSDKLPESREYDTKLFDFNVDYESDWFVHLFSKDKELELGIISRTSEIVPDEITDIPNGFYMRHLWSKILMTFMREQNFKALKSSASHRIHFMDKEGCY